VVITWSYQLICVPREGLLIQWEGVVGNQEVFVGDAEAGPRHLIRAASSRSSCTDMSEGGGAEEWVVEEHDDLEPEPDEAPNEDECSKCARPGELVCCDYCPRSYHLECAGLKVRSHTSKRAHTFPGEGRLLTCQT
jgi:hypothetical protein